MRIDDETHERPDDANDPWRPESLTEEALECALCDCPENVRIEVEVEKPILRGSADKLLGRERTIQEILDGTVKVTQGPKSDQSVRATAITGPPGAGKTSILEEVTKRLEAKEVKVIKLEAAKLASPEAFSTKMKEVEPWKSQDTWRRIGDAIATGTATAADDLLSVWTTLGLSKLVKGIDEADAGPMQAALQAWQAGRVADMSAILKLLQNSSEHGVVIIIDEAQELVAYGTESEEAKNAQIVLKQLNDPTTRANNRVWNVTMIVAGMQDTPEIIGGLSTVRPEEITLGPVTRDVARAMIEGRIRKATVSEGDQQLAIAQWAGPLAERYGDWTRHAQAAGEAARIVLSHGGQAALLEPWGQALLVEQADKYRTKLHEEIISRAETHGVNSELQTTVMDALERNGQSLRAPKLEELIGHWTVLTAGEPNRSLLDEAVTKRVENMVKQMKRAGLISLRNGRYLSPIPSMTTYMTTERKAELQHTLPVIEAAGLNTADPDRNPAGE